jgi:hypothetical protein
VDNHVRGRSALLLQGGFHLEIETNDRKSGSGDIQISMMSYDFPILIFFNENICHGVLENDAMSTQRSVKAKLIGAN